MSDIFQLPPVDPNKIFGPLNLPPAYTGNVLTTSPSLMPLTPLIPASITATKVAGIPIMYIGLGIGGLLLLLVASK